ncbi:hypothetical protein NST12_07305 [Bacillus sp. FSL W8-1127]|uniref:hypothetical protein n=1 Tax=unclassified Bacillus (in: firmicutes) TaxID=185979 RepID=UPI0030F8F9A5
MAKENFSTNTTTPHFVQKTMEEIWSSTCGSWQNCNNANISSFLSQCLEHNIDPQFCFDWISQHSNEIPNWSTVSNTAREWVNQHTSTGSPLSSENGIS